MRRGRIARTARRVFRKKCFGAVDTSRLEQLNDELEKQMNRLIAIEYDDSLEADFDAFYVLQSEHEQELFRVEELITEKEAELEEQIYEIQYQIELLQENSEFLRGKELDKMAFESGI